VIADNCPETAIFDPFIVSLPNVDQASEKG
jgi:hypothetical protein